MRKWFYVIFLLLLLLITVGLNINIQKKNNKTASEAVFSTLMIQVNKMHESIKKPAPDYYYYYPLNMENEAHLEQKLLTVEPKSDGTLTIEQVENDVNYFIHLLRTQYGLYNFFGGDDKFLEVGKNVCDSCRKLTVITLEEFEQILLTNFSFIQDSHFSLNNKNILQPEFPFIYRGMAFDKIENKYRSKENGLFVQYINGRSDLDEILKPSISENGELVYYPVIIQKENPSNLVVLYENGTVEELSCPIKGLDKIEKNELISFSENQGIPIITVNEMGFDETKDDEVGKKFLDYANMVRDERVVIVDLRLNSGGNPVISLKWLNAFTGQRVSTNIYRIYPWKIRHDENFYKNPVSKESFEDFLGYQEIGPTAIDGTIDDVYIKNDRFLIVLMSKQTASAAETFIDAAYNIENVLFIGENSYGCLRTDSGRAMLKMPNSKFTFKMGSSLQIFPNDETYFKEGRGFMPDIWVPASEAERLAVKFVKKYFK